MILGISIPGLIAFTTFWLLNVAIGFGGGNILNKFTAVLTPLIYIVFGGMAIWAFTVAGGIGYKNGEITLKAYVQHVLFLQKSNPFVVRFYLPKKLAVTFTFAILLVLKAWKK